MGAKKYPDRDRPIVTVAATGTGTVKSKRAENGQLICWQSIAFRNRTGTRGSVVLSVVRGEADYPFAEEPAPTANEWWFYDKPVWLKAGEHLQADQSNCQANDVIELSLIGYSVFGSEGEVV